MGSLTTPSNAIIPLRARQLAARAEQQLVVPARLSGETLPVLGMTPRPIAPELVMINGKPWLLASADEDPLAADYGRRLVLPGTERDRLIRLLKGGVDPDVVWIAHELPPGTTAKDIGKVRLPPPAGLVAAERRLTRGLKAAIKGVAIGVGAVAAAPLLALGALGELDPVLLGGVETPERDAVLWVEMARWSW